MRVRVVASILLLASTAHAADFDPDEAKRALEKVHVKQCGYGGPGEVRITFEPTGFVSDVEVYDGRYTDNAIRCIERLFHAPEVLAFDGEARTIKWRIVLPLEKEVVIKPPPRVIASDYKFVDPKKWKEGDRVPPGYRVEETNRPGLAFGGMFLALAGGGILVAMSTKGSDREHADVDLISPTFFLFGGAMALGGAIMMAVGLGSHRSVLAPIRF